MSTREETEIELTPEEEAELNAAIAEADLGGGVPVETVMREIAQMREKEELRRRRSGVR